MFVDHQQVNPSTQIANNALRLNDNIWLSKSFELAEQRHLSYTPDFTAAVFQKPNTILPADTTILDCNATPKPTKPSLLIHFFKIH